MDLLFNYGISERQRYRSRSQTRSALPPTLVLPGAVRNVVRRAGSPKPGPPHSNLGIHTMADVPEKPIRKIQRQKLSLRASLWPELNEADLWHYKKTDGWLTVPRAMPLLLRIMDNLSKGKPVSSAYFDLWCRTFDESFVIVNKAREMAFYSGFTGERAERTWASRIKTLEDLGFIGIKDGPNGPISYVLIYNPYRVIRGHYAAGHVPQGTYNALKQRLIEIGAQDLDQAEAPKAEAPNPEAPKIEASKSVRAPGTPIVRRRLK